LLGPTVRIGVDGTLPPFASYDPYDGLFYGFDIEVMEALGSRAGFKVEFVDIRYDELISAVSRCELDAGISAIPISDDLTYQVDFSAPYYSSGHVLVVKKGNITITGLDDLDGMTVGTQEGSRSAMEVEQIPGVDLNAYGNFPLSLQELVAGYIDAVIADEAHALGFVDVKSNNLKIVGEKFGRLDLGIIVCKDRADLLAKINDGLSALEANGTLDRLVRKWVVYPGQ
jgi:polar amino acid transport system substrate-binding protein